MVDFHGAKLAFISNEQLLVYRRGSNNDISFPGHWDFPGGGREGNESPERCILRELEEEFSIKLDVERLIYRLDYSVPCGSLLSCFFVAYGDSIEVDSIEFGQEGHYWCLMDIDEYLSHDQGIPDLQARLRD